MSFSPWYLNAERPSLKHQRKWKSDPNYTKSWHDKGAKLFQAHKYRKGACQKLHTCPFCIPELSMKCTCFVARPKAPLFCFYGKQDWAEWVIRIQFGIVDPLSKECERGAEWNS